MAKKCKDCFIAIKVNDPSYPYPDVFESSSQFDIKHYVDLQHKFNFCPVCGHKINWEKIENK